MGRLSVDQIEQLAVQAPSDPTSSDDSTLGYLLGMRWLNTTTKRVWTSVDDAPGLAVWRESTPSPGGTADFDKILTTVSSEVVVDNAGNVVTRS